MTEVTIIYLPGLGDRFDPLRRWALGDWRSSARRVEFVAMTWDEPEDTLGRKLDRIEQAIDQAEGRVVLVGESAGAPVALAALDRFGDQISQVVTLCGMNQHADDVRRAIYDKHPTFRETMRRADEVVDSLSSEQADKLDVFYSKYDFTIRPVHTLIDGVRSHATSTLGHIVTISLYITVLRGRIMSIISTQN